MELSKLEEELGKAQRVLLRDHGFAASVKAFVGLSPGVLVVEVRGADVRTDLGFVIEIVDSIGRDLSVLIVERFVKELFDGQNV